MNRIALVAILFLALSCASVSKGRRDPSTALNLVDARFGISLTAAYGTAPEVVRLSVSSDPHWGSGRSDPAARNAIIKRIATASPRKDAFIVLGDIAHFGGRYGEAKKAAGELGAGLDGVPFMAIPGNHDAWFGGLKYFRRYLREQGTAGTGEYESFFSLRAGNALLVFLDMPWSLESFTSTQRDWLVTALETAKWEGHPVIVFSHSFFYSSGITEAIGGVKWFDNKESIGALDPVFRAYGVKLVVSGHNHYMELLESGGVTYAIVGAMGGHFDPEPTYVSPASIWFRQGVHGSLDIDIDSKEIRLRFVDPAGTILMEHPIPL